MGTSCTGCLTSCCSHPVPTLSGPHGVLWTLGSLALSHPEAQPTPGQGGVPTGPLSHTRVPCCHPEPQHRYPCVFACPAGCLPHTQTRTYTCVCYGQRGRLWLACAGLAWAAHSLLSLDGTCLSKAGVSATVLSVMESSKTPWFCTEPCMDVLSPVPARLAEGPGVCPALCRPAVPSFVKWEVGAS